MTIITQTKDKGKCKLHETLKNVVANRTDPLAVEVADKLSYAACIRAEEAKYHRDCMQRFMSGVTVIPGPINKRHLHKSKNDGFEKFCNWYESTSHDTTSSFTLFEVQKHIEDNGSNDEDAYSIRQLSRKLSAINCQNVVSDSISLSLIKSSNFTLDTAAHFSNLSTSEYETENPTEWSTSTRSRDLDTL